MSLTNLSASIARIFTRSLHQSALRLGPDKREKRVGHLEAPDRVEGESPASLATSQGSNLAYELVDENILDRVINNVKFKDIPVIHIKCTRNNTKISLTTGDGTSMAVKTAGTEGFKNCRKGTTVAAQSVASRIITLAKDNDVTMARMVFNGLGPGRNAAFKVFEMSSLNIVSLSDRTQAAEPWNFRPRKTKRI